jgi:hypothetical protein
MSPLETQLLFARAVLLILLYSFIAAVGILAWLDLWAARRSEAADVESAVRSRLIVLSAGSSDRAPGTAFPLEPVTAVGRDFDCDIVLADPTISGRHAVLDFREGAWWVEDLGSTNGTFVNGNRVHADSPALLRSGDVLELGAVRLRLAAVME